MADCEYTIIGGGIIGTSVAYALLGTGKEICLLDKNKKIPGENQSSRNSGVIHSGILYNQKISPLKAKLSVEGNKMLYEFCEKYGVPVKRTGKLVVATDNEEDRSLDLLLKRAEENGVVAEKITREMARQKEPGVKAYSALWVPSTGIVEPTSLLRRLRDMSEAYVLKGTEVTGIESIQGGFLIKAMTQGTGYNEFTTKKIINAAGLHSDEIARMVNPDFPLKIYPVRGESAKFYRKKGQEVNTNVYPAPIFYRKPDGTMQISTGVHLSPIIDEEGNLSREMIIGPLNSKKGCNKEDYGTDLSRPEEYLKHIKYYPGISEEDIHLHQTGIQAVLENSQDFHIAKDKRNPNMINAVGIGSPGLTSSPAIAKMIKELVEQKD